MTLRQLVLLAILALGVGLLGGVPLSPVAAAEPVSVVKFDSKTRVVTVRAATGKTYQCIVPADQKGSLLKPGVKVEVDTKTAQAAEAKPTPTPTPTPPPPCGGWNGPRDAPTKPTTQPMGTEQPKK